MFPPYFLKPHGADLPSSSDNCHYSFKTKDFTVGLRHESLLKKAEIVKNGLF
jgi:hypothetical protein